MADDARRLMKHLVGKGCDTQAPIANAQIQAWAAEIDLDDAVIAAAGANGWLADGPRQGTTSLTQSGWDSGNA